MNKEGKGAERVTKAKERENETREERNGAKGNGVIARDRTREMS